MTPHDELVRTTIVGSVEETVSGLLSETCRNGLDSNPSSEDPAQ